MKPVLYTRLSGYYKRIRQRLDRNFFIFLFFLFLSGLFWLLNELNKESISDITYPVRYNNLDSRKILVNEVPNSLILKVQAPGYTLLKSKLSPRLIPINLDMRSYLLRQNEMLSSDYFLLTKDLHGRFTRRLASDIKILEIQPDTIFFQFDSVIYKKVPVVADISYSLLRQFMLRDEIRTTPDSMGMTGPGKILDTLQYINTVHESYQELNNTVQQEIKLVRIPKITYDQKEVLMTIPVEQFTEANLRIPIETVHVPDSIILKTFPNQVSLTCIAGLSDYEKLSAHLFRVEVNFESIDFSLGDKLKVNIVSSPEFVQSIRIYPIYVDFIIENK